MGLTGDQGVMIPRRNLSQLMLRSDVVQAVRDGQFHVWAVCSIEEGLEVLTSTPPGSRVTDPRTWNPCAEPLAYPVSGA